MILSISICLDVIFMWPQLPRRLFINSLYFCSVWRCLAERIDSPRCCTCSNIFSPRAINCSSALSSSATGLCILSFVFGLPILYCRNDHAVKQITINQKICLVFSAVCLVSSYRLGSSGVEKFGVRKSGRCFEMAAGVGV